jgi:maleate isomerase
LLLAVAPKSILFGFTSTSYIDGPEGDPPLVARIERASKGIPVILPTRAATEALRFLGARRISIIHQPWFSEEANSLGREYFQKVGFDVMSCTRVEPLRRMVEEVPPAEIYDWVVSHTPSKADAVFIGGNGGRVIGAIDAIEKRLKKNRYNGEPSAALVCTAPHRPGLESKSHGRVFSAG